MDETKTFNARFPADVLAAIDERAKAVGLSRNEWLVKCSRWAIHNLPYRADRETKIKAVAEAPHDVAGDHPVDMGLGEIEGK